MIALEASADIMLINAWTKKQVIEDEWALGVRCSYVNSDSVTEINHQESDKMNKNI